MMKRSFVCVIIASLVLTACQARREVADIWNYVQERPDSALTVLNGLDAGRYRGRTMAEYRLLKAMALDKNYIDVASDSLALPAAEYFHKFGPREKEMMSLYYLGMAQYYAKDNNKAAVTLDRTISLAKACNNIRYSGLANMGSSYAYSNERNWLDAITAANTGIEFFSMLPDSSLQVRRAKLQLADCYHGNHQFQEACDIYADILAKAPVDTFLQRRGLCSYAWSLYLLDHANASKAVALFEKAIKEYHAPLNAYRAHHYANTLLEAGRKDEAKSILHLLEQTPDNPELEMSLRYQILRSEGRINEALEVYEALVDIQNEVVRETLNQSLVRSQRDYHAQAEEMEKLASAHLKERLLFLCVLFIIILSSGTAFFYSYRNKAEEKKEELITNFLEARQIIEDISAKNTNLENELERSRQRYVKAYKKQFQKTAALVENYYSSSDKQNRRDIVYRQVMELATHVGNDRESMKALERNVNVALDNAMALYREECPGRDREHYDLVCYFMAGFPASLIELYTKMPRNTIYSKKRRLLAEIQDSTAPHKEFFLLVIK